MFPRRNFRSAQDWHRHYVYSDTDFAKDVTALEKIQNTRAASPVVGRLEQAIAKKWSVNVADINMFIMGQILYLEHQTSTASLHLDLEKKEVSIKFTPSTARAEVLEQWDKFEQMRARLFPVKPTKRKPAQLPELVYAIFKCRQRSLTFRQIFELYSSGKLPGFTGSTSQYKDEDSLEKYYQANKPAPVNSALL